MLRPSAVKATLGLSAGLILAAAFGWPQLAASRVYQDPSLKLRQLQQLDTALTQDVLGVAFGLLRHYDTLHQTNESIERLTDDLAGSLGTVREAADLHRTIEAYRAIHAERTGELERFKSAIAKLRNSVQLLPRVIEDFIAERLPGDTANDALSTELKSLLTDVLVQQIAYDVQHTSKLQDRIVALSGRAYVGRVLTDPELLVVAKHAEVIVSERAKVEQLVTKLASQQGAGVLRQWLRGR